MNAKTPRAPVALPETMHPEQRIAMPMVEQLTGRRKSHLYGEEKAGRFPAGERDGSRCTRWRVGDVLAWLANPPKRPASAHMPQPTSSPKPKPPPPVKKKTPPAKRRPARTVETAAAEAL